MLWREKGFLVFFPRCFEKRPFARQRGEDLLPRGKTGSALLAPIEKKKKTANVHGQAGSHGPAGFFLGGFFQFLTGEAYQGRGAHNTNNRGVFWGGVVTFTRMPGFFVIARGTG